MLAYVYIYIYIYIYIEQFCIYYLILIFLSQNKLLLFKKKIHALTIQF